MSTEKHGKTNYKYMRIWGGSFGFEEMKWNSALICNFIIPFISHIF